MRRIWRVSSSTPRPKPSTPALLEITVRLRTPESRSARIRFSGMPHRPKPPDITVMPSRVSPASAAFASAKILLDALALLSCIDLLRRMRGREGRQVIAVFPDQRKPWIAHGFDPESFGREHLWHQAAVGHGGRVAVAEPAGEPIVLDVR